MAGNKSRDRSWDVAAIKKGALQLLFFVQFYCEEIDVLIWWQCPFKRGRKLGRFNVNKEVQAHGRLREEKAANISAIIYLSQSEHICSHFMSCEASLVCHL